jgi:hypothetical protein
MNVVGAGLRVRTLTVSGEETAVTYAFDDLASML